MNRIRYNGENYEVLISPTQPFQVGVGYLFGNWTDNNFMPYEIKEFSLLNSAFEYAIKYPDIDWDQIILYNKDIFDQLHTTISTFGVPVISHIMTPQDIKNTMFNRVIEHGKKFRLIKNLNDIITFTLFVDKLTITHLFKRLISCFELRIMYQITKTINNINIIELIGKTTVGTTYTIKLVQLNDNNNILQ